MARWTRWAAAACLLALAAAARGDPSALGEADRAQFAWFDRIGLPSCAGKPYVRVRWVREGASQGVPRAADLWVVDGFRVAEHEGTMTILDGDLWPRKVPRTPEAPWSGTVETLDLRRQVQLAARRIECMRSDPGAVEAMDVMYPGVRLRFGDEAQSLAFARHAAENGLEEEAHALLEAARALPPLPGVGEGATFAQVVAAQLAEGVFWRVLFDFSDPATPRAALLARLRGWIASFPDDEEYYDRAEDLLEVLPGMVEEDAQASGVEEGALDALDPDARARALVVRLRDQGGDVVQDGDGRVQLELGADDSPANRLLQLGRAALPALVDALADARTTRAVLFIGDTSPRRLVVARVGDFARVIVEAIAKDTYWDVPENAPSMFQHAAARQVQRHWRRWLEDHPAPAAASGEEAK